MQNICMKCNMILLLVCAQIVYFTAVFPLVIMLLLFIRGITLPHAIDGVIFYVKPDFSRLTDITVRTT